MPDSISFLEGDVFFAEEVAETQFTLLQSDFPFAFNQRRGVKLERRWKPDFAGIKDDRTAVKWLMRHGAMPFLRELHIVQHNEVGGIERVWGYYALVRTEHPGTGYLSPTALTPLFPATERGLVLLARYIEVVFSYGGLIAATDAIRPALSINPNGPVHLSYTTPVNRTGCGTHVEQFRGDPQRPLCRGCRKWLQQHLIPIVGVVAVWDMEGSPEKNG